MANKKNPVGRPTAYKPEYCQMLIEHMKQGFTFDSFAGRLMVAISTLYVWEAAYPEFLEAKKVGRGCQQLTDEETLQKITQGKIKNGNITGLIFKMKNCHRWTDRIEQEITARDKTIEDLIKEAKGTK